MAATNLVRVFESTIQSAYVITEDMRSTDLFYAFKVTSKLQERIVGVLTRLSVLTHNQATGLQWNQEQTGASSMTNENVLQSNVYESSNNDVTTVQEEPEIKQNSPADIEKQFDPQELFPHSESLSKDPSQPMSMLEESLLWATGNVPPMNSAQNISVVSQVQPEPSSDTTRLKSFPISSTALGPPETVFPVSAVSSVPRMSESRPSTSAAASKRRFMSPARHYAKTSSASAFIPRHQNIPSALMPELPTLSASVEQNATGIKMESVDMEEASGPSQQQHQQMIDPAMYPGSSSYPAESIAHTQVFRTRKIVARSAVPPEIYRVGSWTIMVKRMLCHFFTRTELANASVTGKKGSMGAMAKPCLDPAVVAFIKDEVNERFPFVTNKHMKKTVSEKLYDEWKAFNKRLREVRSMNMPNLLNS